MLFPDFPRRMHRFRWRGKLRFVPIIVLLLASLSAAGAVRAEDADSQQGETADRLETHDEDKGADELSLSDVPDSGRDAEASASDSPSVQNSPDLDGPVQSDQEQNDTERTTTHVTVDASTPAPSSRSQNDSSDERANDRTEVKRSGPGDTGGEETRHELSGDARNLDSPERPGRIVSPVPDDEPVDLVGSLATPQEREKPEPDSAVSPAEDSERLSSTAPPRPAPREGRFEQAGRGVSRDAMLAALEVAAEAGEPSALWQLGQMYEQGNGVQKDPVRAFGYFSRIANDNANVPPHSVEADIVARSFIKVGDYLRAGLPDAGIAANERQARALLIHAASYFGDADAQYRVGLLYLDDEKGNGDLLLSLRWLSLAARKNHAGAQAVLGDILFNGRTVHSQTLPPQPVEGLMWLTLAFENSRGANDDPWIAELLTRAMSVATPDQRLMAQNAASAVRGQLGSR